MNKTVNRLERAANIAARSGLARFKTGAVIYNRDESVSYGWSHYSDLRLQRYRSIHAELHAIFRAWTAMVSGGDIYIATIRGKSGNIGLAKPCVLCQEYLYEVGIRKAYYTISGSEYDCLNF